MTVWHGGELRKAAASVIHRRPVFARSAAHPDNPKVATSLVQTIFYQPNASPRSRQRLVNRNVSEPVIEERPAFRQCADPLQLGHDHRMPLKIDFDNLAMDGAPQNVVVIDLGPFQAAQPFFVTRALGAKPPDNCPALEERCAGFRCGQPLAANLAIKELKVELQSL